MARLVTVRRRNPGFVDSLMGGVATGTGLGLAAGVMGPLAVHMTKRAAKGVGVDLDRVEGSKNPYTDRAGHLAGYVLGKHRKYLSNDYVYLFRFLAGLIDSSSLTREETERLLVEADRVRKSEGSDVIAGQHLTKALERVKRSKNPYVRTVREKVLKSWRATGNLMLKFSNMKDADSAIGALKANGYKVWDSVVKVKPDRGGEYWVVVVPPNQKLPVPGMIKTMIRDHVRLQKDLLKEAGMRNPRLVDHYTKGWKDGAKERLKPRYKYWTPDDFVNDNKVKEKIYRYQLKTDAVQAGDYRLGMKYGFWGRDQKFGIFPWRGDGHYHAPDAVAVFNSYTVADAKADEMNEAAGGNGNLVVREL